jgi:hypothetical protein
MTLLPDTREDQLSQLLGCTVAQLDITPDAYRAAERRYLDVGRHLKDEGADIYVQGSILLGTVVAPYGRRGDYDLDLVCRWNVAKASQTKAELKARVGSLLDGYIHLGESVDVEVPELGEGRRSWKLGYRQFHMDVLPAIPDEESRTGTGILLTDKQLREWQHSDPQAYARWFKSRCVRQLEHAREAMAKAAGTLEPVPDWQIRTPLHRVVQVLKRHRDVYFGDDLDDRPPSSLITTLSAQAYDGEDDLLAATLSAVQRMPSLIDVRDGTHWVANPVCEEENFADKWNDYPLRRRKFLKWRDQVESDLEGLLDEHRGARQVHEHLAKAFGTDAVAGALEAIGTETRERRENEGLRVNALGSLTTGAGRAVVDHRFFGGSSRS